MGNNMKQRALNLRRSMKAYLYPLACQDIFYVLVSYNVEHYDTATLRILLPVVNTYGTRTRPRPYMVFRSWYYAIQYGRCMYDS